MKEPGNIQFRLLTEEEVLEGYENQLDIFKRYGTQCTPDDYALACGVRAENYMGNIHNRQLKSDLSIGLKTGLANYWIDEMVYNYLTNKSYCIGIDGNEHMEYVDIRDIGMRPVVTYSTIKDLCSDEFIGKDGITRVTFSKKLSRAVDWKKKKKLYYAIDSGNFHVEKEYILRNLIQKGNDAYDNFLEHIQIGSYQGDTYALVRVNIFSDEPVKLSNGICYENNAHVWLKEEPCMLLVDKKRDLAVFEHIIAGGLPYQFKNDFLEETLPKLLHMDTSKEKENKEVHFEFAMNPDQIVSLCRDGNITLRNIYGERVKIHMESPKQKIKK